MKTIVCLIGVAALFLANGCATKPQDRGGYYGAQESGYGTQRSHPPGHERGFYWDEQGYYHEYGPGWDRRATFLR